jgi:hypothetical protein
METPGMGCYEHGNGPSGSIKGWKVFDRLCLSTGLLHVIKYRGRLSDYRRLVSVTAVESAAEKRM